MEKGFPIFPISNERQGNIVPPLRLKQPMGKGVIAPLPPKMGL